MAEAAPEISEKDEGGEVRRVRPPDRKRFEEEQETLTLAIQAKQTELKSVTVRPEDNVQPELNGIRAEKDATIRRRKKIDIGLSELNQAIRKQMEELTKIKTNLQYKNEERIDEAIRRLEQQIKRQNFSLREEKQIVAEIDRLKRSKKSLVQYITLKKEIDDMRDRQRRMREERDRYYKAVTNLKTREEDLKKRTKSRNERFEELKREIEILEEQKRQSYLEFKRIEKEYFDVRNEQRKKRNDELRKKQDEERRAQQEAYQQELAEIEASREPYEEEKVLCSALLTYLQRYLTSEEEKTTSSSPEQPDLNPDAVSDAEPQGMFVLKKKDEDLFGGVTKQKVGKRNKREKRRLTLKTERPIVHNPETLSQFAQLHLKAPSNVAEVAKSIEALQAKKLYYHSLPAPSIQPVITVDGTQAELGSDGSAGAPSFTESAISESVLSTPEVQSENHQPSFPTRDDPTSVANWPKPRRLSKDSGTELEENSCDEIPPDDVTNMAVAMDTITIHKHTHHSCNETVAELSPGLLDPASFPELSVNCTLTEYPPPQTLSKNLGSYENIDECTDTNRAIAKRLSDHSLSPRALAENNIWDTHSQDTNFQLTVPSCGSSVNLPEVEPQPDILINSPTPSS